MTFIVIKDFTNKNNFRYFWQVKVSKKSDIIAKIFIFLYFQNILGFDKLKDSKGSKQKDLNNFKLFQCINDIKISKSGQF